jgi:hypothetical protein
LRRSSDWFADGHQFSGESSPAAGLGRCNRPGNLVAGGAQRGYDAILRLGDVHTRQLPYFAGTAVAYGLP